MRLARRDDLRGTTLMEVLIAIGLLLIMCFAGIMAYNYRVASRRAAQAAGAGGDVDLVLRTVLANKISTYLKTGCVTPSSFPGTASVSIGSSLTVAPTLTPTPDQSSQTQKDAANRCATQTVPDLNGSSVYYCLGFSQATGATSLANDTLQRSFSPGNYAPFVEVSGNLMDMRGGGSIDCDTFSKVTGTAGAVVYYAIYWSQPASQTGTVSKQRAGVIYVPAS
jgi:hypothetical protein